MLGMKATQCRFSKHGGESNNYRWESVHEFNPLLICENQSHEKYRRLKNGIHCTRRTEIRGLPNHTKREDTSFEEIILHIIIRGRNEGYGHSGHECSTETRGFPPGLSESQARSVIQEETWSPRTTVLSFVAPQQWAKNTEQSSQPGIAAGAGISAKTITIKP